jgi:hypothetical protein
VRWSHPIGYAPPVIAVVGDLLGRPPLPDLAVEVAGRVARRGGPVQVVGVLPADAHGDRRMIELGGAAVGHAAVLRSPADRLEAAEVELALGYLADLRVVVAVALPADLLAAAGAGAGYADADLVVIASTVADLGPLPDTAIVLQAPPADPDGAFAGLVAALVVRLDAGAVPAAAWAETLRDLGVEGRR